MYFNCCWHNKPKYTMFPVMFPRWITFFFWSSVKSQITLFCNRHTNSLVRIWTLEIWKSRRNVIHLNAYYEAVTTMKNFAVQTKRQFSSYYFVYLKIRVPFENLSRTVQLFQGPFRKKCKYCKRVHYVSYTIMFLFLKTNNEEKRKKRKNLLTI